jgi:hypothetical protein
MELKGFLSDEAAALLDVGVSPVDDAQAKIHAQPFSEARKSVRIPSGMGRPAHLGIKDPKNII